ncbi:SKICH domain-containing protein [Entamoeba marina]
MSKQSEIHLVLPLNSHCIRCKLDICEQDLNKKLWIGIYVYKRQYDNKYCEYKPVDVNKQIIEFEQLPDGIYEARLFENRFTKLATSKPILIGTPVEVTTEFNYQFPYVINVSYDKCSSHSDWIGLFETSTYSMKKFIKSYSVSIQQNHISVDLSILKIDAMEDGDDDNIIKPKAYEFRYFKNISKISNTTAPSGISKPFLSYTTND